MTKSPPPVFFLPGIRLNFTYTNHRGEMAVRHVRPLFMEFVATEWHPEAQWILRAIDMDKDVERLFAMRDMKDVSYAE